MTDATARPISSSPSVEECLSSAASVWPVIFSRLSKAGTPRALAASGNLTVASEAPAVEVAGRICVHHKMGAAPLATRGQAAVALDMVSC
jgi:hypothetical protein